MYCTAHVLYCCAVLRGRPKDRFVTPITAYCTVLYCSLLDKVSTHSPLQYSSVLYCPVILYCIQYCTVLYTVCCTVLYSTKVLNCLRYCLVLYCTVPCNTILYCTVQAPCSAGSHANPPRWESTVRYRTVLSCTALLYPTTSGRSNPPSGFSDLTSARSDLTSARSNPTSGCSNLQ